ncbi:hypothetical protein E2986_13476 [Frieseomelitta varia]|uniref:Uncharacterized protein n=1 Tax=Frieseomelitta varia TaxID=561572 RepID=A0A833RZJ7_9HYME|nr:hypothetical protein E2986_13476 [Frieseomelitta varia]
MTYPEEQITDPEAQMTDSQTSPVSSTTGPSPAPILEDVSQQMTISLTNRHELAVEFEMFTRTVMEL